MFQALESTFRIHEETIVRTSKLSAAPAMTGALFAGILLASTTFAQTPADPPATTGQQQIQDARCEQLSGERRTECERMARERAQRRANASTGAASQQAPAQSQGSSTSRDAGSMNHPGVQSPRASTKSSRPNTAVTSGDKDIEKAVPEARRSKTSEAKATADDERRSARSQQRRPAPEQPED